MELQELIARGRFIFANAPGRLNIFELVNGRLSAKVIAKKLGREFSNVLRDLQSLRDLELVQPKRDKMGRPMKADGSIIYEKTPLARQIPLTYFGNSTKGIRHLKPATVEKRGGVQRTRSLPVPSENEILDICKRGEDETYEFKGPGAEVRDITKGMTAFLHTRQGGIILYGVEDGGAIAGSDLSKQRLDQAVQNSVRNTIKPAANVQLRSVQVLGANIVLIIVPPWNRKDVYYYEGRVYLRKGTNVFVATPEEIKRLHRGEYII